MKTLAAVALAVALPCGCFELCAQTTVTLVPAASPSSGQAGVTTVSVLGSGFPSGTIPPANVQVTFGCTKATTTASAVQILYGSTERVTFTVPAAASVTSPTACPVSITGSTSGGATFSSGTPATFTLNPPAQIVSIQPNSGAPGQTLQVTLTGLYTNFVQGATLASFGPSISVGGSTDGQLGPVTVTSATTATAQIAISSAGKGPQAVVVATGIQEATLNNAFTIAGQPLQITTASPLPAATVGVSYSEALAAAGGTAPYTWAVTAGSLPAGLSLNSGTGLISGQPTAAGASNFTIQVSDSTRTTASKAFAMTTNPALAITTSSPLPAGTVGASYSQTLAATGGSGQYTWSISAGSLPAGLTLASATGVISGVPTSAVTAGFTAKVTDSNNVVATKVFVLTINPQLLITTKSPLPAATVAVVYSQTFTASGGAGGYKWSAAGLPSWLTMSTGGLLAGTPPLTATDSTFTVTVTDAANNTTSAPFVMPVTLAITTSSPLPPGQVGVSYAQTLTAAGGTGVYTWALTAGSLPSGLSLAAATGLISGQPTTAATANFTIKVTDSNQATASQTFALTITPAASIQSLSPNSSYAGLSLEVTITGSNTHFSQGETVANFGPGIAVGGANAGQPGPVTVISPTSATAQIAISAEAATGSQTVTVTTGAEQASLANGFTIQGAIPYISLTDTATTALAPGFSGFNDPYIMYGIEYWDPKWLAMVEPLKAGWVRFPAGLISMGFDWQTAHMNYAWMQELQPLIPSGYFTSLELTASMTQAKGGACFSGGTCISDYATFLRTIGANGLVCFNGYTDNNPNSAGLMVNAAQAAGVNMIEWEIDNEPYTLPEIYPTSASYAAAAYNPYYSNISAANPNATVGLFYQGSYITIVGNYRTWDKGMAAYSPHYWNAATFHIYPITNSTMAVSAEEQTLNGILAHGTTDWYSSYVQPVVGENTPVFITEVNTDVFSTMAFESYIYNAIFLAEFTARMSTIPQIHAVGINALFLPNEYNMGAIRAVDDFQSYLLGQVTANPNYSTDTATDPNTQYSFYYSTNALAMEIANLAINNSNATYPTTVTGGPTVPIEGYDGNPVPAIYAQGYQGIDGTHYLLITNKSSSAVQMAVEFDGNMLQSTLTVSYISSATDTAQNTATAQDSVQIVNGTSGNPIMVGPYSVMRVQW